jgi:hypothetical protein
MKGFSLRIRFVLSGNFGLFWESYLINDFFKDAIPKKVGFQISEPTNQILNFLAIHATTLWILFSKPRSLDSRLEGCGICVIDGLFFEVFGR